MVHSIIAAGICFVTHTPCINLLLGAMLMGSLTLEMHIRTWLPCCHLDCLCTTAIINVLTHICMPVAMNMVVHPRLTYEHESPYHQGLHTQLCRCCPAHHPMSTTGTCPCQKSWLSTSSQQRKTYFEHCPVWSGRHFSRQCSF